MRRALLAALLGALAAATSAGAAVPIAPSGSALGEGVPLKAYATVTPTVHLFGDAITARLAIVADTKLLDPGRLHVSTDFKPYTLVRQPTVAHFEVGRFAQLTWTWTLHCLGISCVPVVPPSDKYHVFRFQTIHITYPQVKGRPAYEVDASWPKVEVLSQVTPGVATFLKETNHFNWHFELAPVAAPAYRVSPGLLYWLALGGAGALFLLAAFFGARWLRAEPADQTLAGRTSTGTTLDRALAVLAWAHARGDETLQRKALERVAGELRTEAPLPAVDELSRTARELAWSQRTPEDEEVETFSERARGTAHSEEEK